MAVKQGDKQSDWTQTSGKCLLCKKTFAGRSMGRHLEACLNREEAGPETGGKNLKLIDTFHLAVESPDSIYWLHLLMGTKEPIGELDGLLRAMWLNCCGHMSAFRIGKIEIMDFDEGDYGLDVPIGEVADVKTRIDYTYDFGSSTELVIQVVGRHQQPAKKEPLVVVARNEPPQIPCGLCGAPAKKVCPSCSYDADAWLCSKCARRHECGPEMMLKIVNSPRTGVCAYEG